MFSSIKSFSANLFRAESHGSTEAVTHGGTQSAKGGDYGYSRPFKSQVVGEKLFNNCWACSINALKGRNDEDYSRFNELEQLNGYNNANEGFEISDIPRLLSAHKVGKVASDSHSYKDMITACNQFEGRLQKDSKALLTHDEKSAMLSFLSEEMEGNGPLLMIREAVGSGSIHAICIIDIDSKNEKVLAANSMDAKPTWRNINDFSDDMILAAHIDSDEKYAEMGVQSYYFDENFHANDAGGGCTIL